MSEHPKKPSILIVDDDPNVVLGLSNVLEDDYRLEVVADGTSAIELQRRKHCDVIILDMLLPGMDGYEIALAIREFDPLAPIIVNTGYTSSYPFTEVGKRIDPMAYLVKGELDIDNKTLLSTVKSALRYRRAMASHQARSSLPATEFRATRSDPRPYWRDGLSGVQPTTDLFQRLRFIIGAALLDLEDEVVVESVRIAEGFLRAESFTLATATLSTYLIHVFSSADLPAPKPVPLRSLLRPISERARLLQLGCIISPAVVPELQLIARPDLLASVWKTLFERLLFDSEAEDQSGLDLTLEINHESAKAEATVVISITRRGAEGNEVLRLAPSDAEHLREDSLELDLLATRLIMASHGGEVSHPDPAVARLHFSFAVGR